MKTKLNTELEIEIEPKELLLMNGSSFVRPDKIKLKLVEWYQKL